MLLHYLKPPMEAHFICSKRQQTCELPSKRLQRQFDQMFCEYISRDPQLSKLSCLFLIYSKPNCISMTYILSFWWYHSTYYISQCNTTCYEKNMKYLWLKTVQVYFSLPQYFGSVLGWGSLPHGQSGTQTPSLLWLFSALGSWRLHSVRMWKKKKGKVCYKIFYSHSIGQSSVTWSYWTIQDAEICSECLRGKENRFVDQLVGSAILSLSRHMTS